MSDTSCCNKTLLKQEFEVEQEKEGLYLYIRNIKQRKLEANQKYRYLKKRYNRSESLATLILEKLHQHRNK